MNQTWDGGDLAFQPHVWREILRVMKPGAHLLAFGGTRTYHKLASAIDDAGFEIRDQIGWLYGGGMPKSWDISKAIGRAQRDELASEAAQRYAGWGTALRPSHEPICVARKPLAGTVASNVLAYGTGGFNIDGCRIAYLSDADRDSATPDLNGRWPANVILDDSDAVLEAFGAHREAARYFYCAKASKQDRCGSDHPTIKPIALLRYLCRLITPEKGIVLDPFAGSGTTGEAAVLEGFHAVLIEREDEYAEDIRQRLALFLDA